MAIPTVAPRAAALAATIALLAPGAALAQAAQDSSLRNTLTTDQLNQQMLMAIQQDPEALVPEGGAMMGTSGLTEAERMGLLQARFNEVSSTLYAAEQGDIALSDAEILQLRQHRQSLAQELQLMADAGVQPVMPESMMAGSTLGADHADDMAGAELRAREATLDERLQDPSLTAMPAFEDEVEVFEDSSGNRYVRADVYDRMMMARTGTSGSAEYQVFVDDQGTRYYRIGANDQPMMMGSAGLMSDEATLDERLEDPSLTTNPAFEEEVEIFEDAAGNRYMRVGPDNRIMGAPAGSTMASMDLSGYPIYEDAQGNRYVMVDANNRPMMTSSVQ